MTSLRILGRQTLVYGLSGAAPQIVGLVTLPIIARVLTTSDYGVLELATVAVAFAGILADLGLASGSQRSFFDYSEEDDGERRCVLATTLLAMGASVAVLATLAIALRSQLANALFGSASGSVVVWMAVFLVATQLASFAREVLRLHFWATTYLVSSVVAAVLGGVASVVGVAVFDGGPKAMLAGGALGAAGSAIVGLVRAAGRYVGRPSGAELRRMLSYGLPLIPTALSVWALTFVDRLLLQHLGSLSEVGRYAMANRLASVPLLCVTAFGVAFSPFGLDLHSRDPVRERIVRTQAMTALVAGLVVVGTTVSVLAREALHILAPRFEGAADTVGLLCLGTLLYGIASIVMLEISIARKTRIFAVYATIGATANIALNVVLIPPLGSVGAGLATVAAFAVLAAGYWVHAQRIARTPYDTALVLELTAAGVVLGSLGLLPRDRFFLLVKLAGLAVLAAYLLARGLVSRRILASVLDAVGRRRG